MLDESAISHLKSIAPKILSKLKNTFAFVKNSLKEPTAEELADTLKKDGLTKEDLYHEGFREQTFLYFFANIVTDRPVLNFLNGRWPKDIEKWKKIWNIITDDDPNFEKFEHELFRSPDHKKNSQEYIKRNGLPGVNLKADSGSDFAKKYTKESMNESKTPHLQKLIRKCINEAIEVKRPINEELPDSDPLGLRLKQQLKFLESNINVIDSNFKGHENDKIRFVESYRQTLSKVIQFGKEYLSEARVKAGLHKGQDMEEGTINELSSDYLAVKDTIQKLKHVKDHNERLKFIYSLVHSGKLNFKQFSTVFSFLASKSLEESNRQTPTK